MYNKIISGIATNFRENNKPIQIIINRYLTKLFFNEKSLNFKENNGNSAFIKIDKTIVVIIRKYLFNTKPEKKENSEN